MAQRDGKAPQAPEAGKAVQAATPVAKDHGKRDRVRELATKVLLERPPFGLQ